MALSDYLIVVSSENSPVRIINVLEGARIGSETDEQLLERMAKENGGIVVENDPKTFWADREFRSAWRFNANRKRIDIDFESVKSDLMRGFRKRRNVSLIRLDVPFMRALETDNQSVISEIRTKKQELRDLPPIIEQRLDAIINDSKLNPKRKLEELSNFTVPELIREE